MNLTQKKIPIDEAIKVLERLDEKCLATTIEHLQFRRKTVKDLKSNNIDSLQKLIKSADDYYGKKLLLPDKHKLPQLWSSIEFEIEDKFCQLAQASISGKIDWILFWDTIGYEFTYAAAKLDEVFNFDNKTKALTIDSLNIGKAVFALKEDGIQTVGDLIPRLSAGLPNYRGFGNNKLWIFACGLRDFIGTCNTERTTSSLSITTEPRLKAPTYRGSLYYRANNRAKMTETTKKLTLAQLHLHKEINKLQSIGVEQLDHLLDLFEKGLPDIKGVGRAARINLLKTVKCIDLAVTDEGGINWQIFSQLSEMSIYPEPEITLQNGDEFLASLDHVVLSLTTKCFDAIESATLTQRLIPDTKSTTTLEGIARNFGVTRERIRQKQKIILSALSAALIDNEYEGINFRFSEEFSAYWQKAARHFGANHTLSYFDFITGLSEVWKVDEAKIRRHLPLIYAILTKDSMLPSEFAVNSFLPVEVFTISQRNDLDRTFTSLHPTRTLAKYAENTRVTTLGQLLTLLRSAVPPFSEAILKKFFQAILLPLSKSVAPSGAVCWEKYYHLKNIELIPAEDTASSADFVKVASATVGEFVQRTRITARAEGILIHRILPDAATRKTLSETAQIHSCAGSQIKRAENELLRRIHDAIFSNDYTDSGVHFRDSFIQKWKNSARISQQAKSVNYFAELLGLEWGMSKDIIMKVVPMITSVIKGRPLGYTGKRYSLNSNCATVRSSRLQHTNEKSVTNAVIRLRGFRYVH